VQVRFLLVLPALLLVGACGVARAPRTDTASLPVQTRLRVAWWGSTARHERTIRVLQMFEKENPGVAVDYEYGNWNDYWTRLTTQAAGNNLPDLIQQDYQYLTEWAGRDLVVPLEPAMERGDLDLKGAAESSLAGGRVGGRLFGVSLGVNSECMMLDVDAFQRAGLDLPSPTWTWADFERICIALSRRLGVPAMSGNIVHDHIWRSLYLGRGLWAFSADGTALGYPPAGDAVFAAQLRTARRLVAAGAMIPWSAIVAGRTKAVEDDWIVTGRSAITFLWSNQVVAAWTAAGVDTRHFALRPLPRLAPGAGSSNYLKPSLFFSVTASGAAKPHAARLISYFVNSIPANQVLLAERGVPIVAAVRDALKPLLAAPQRTVFDFLDRIQPDVAPVPPPDPVGATDLINNVFIPQVVDPVMFGVLSPEEGMKILRASAAKILAPAR
jgi:multiple sugar transport system substrate-binding protein